MEVIGAGWGRTGTKSLQVALDKLGLPCYHMKELIHKRPNDAAVWLKASRGEPVDFQQLLADYKACTDWPTTSYYKELMQLYPDAKVILTVRDPTKWCKSVRDTIWRARQLAANAPWYVNVVMRALAPSSSFRGMIDALIWQGDLQGCDLDDQPDKAQQLFLDHMEAVIKAVPPERLLVYEVSQGWGPLCDFLGKPVPQEPFPRVNDTAEFQQMINTQEKVIKVLTYAVPAVAAVMVAGLAVGAQRLMSRQG